MNVSALGTIGLDVKDVDRWTRFATKILGAAAGERTAAGSQLLRLDERGHRIALVPGRRDDLAYLGWEVAGEPELRAVTERLEAAGVNVGRADAEFRAERGVAQLVFCTDSNGIRNEISYGAQPTLAPFSSPRGIPGFVTGDQGVGHVVLSVEDASAAMTFYRDLLGLRVSDFIDFEREPGIGVHMTFLHCNERHHSLAFVERPGAARRLSHLMLEMRSIDDVGATFSLCEREGVPIAMSLGRHTNDEMFSFYLITPSGFNIEIGFGGKSIDDEGWEVRTYDAASVWGHRRQAPAQPPLSTSQPEGLLR
jgi:2,3-dihydroxybiphenyl 1,2-dioxygenase